MSGNEEWAARRRAIAAGRYWVSPVGTRPRWRKAIFNRLLWLFGAILRLTPLHRRGVANALDLRRLDIEVAIVGLPAAFDGYRILQLTDTHLDVLPEIVERAAKQLEGIRVDMLALTGDIYGHAPHPLERSVELLMRVLEGVSVRGPRLAVLGNHDPVEMAGLLEAHGFEVLVNETRLVEHHGGRLRVTGTDDVHNFYTEAARDVLSVPGEGGIALVHSAELADVAAAAGYGLYLAGHTHAGQICLSGGKPVVTQLACCKHAAAGLWRQGEMVGYTSAGVGVSEPPVRFNCRGEVTIFTLRQAVGRAG